MKEKFKRIFEYGRTHKAIAVMVIVSMLCGIVAVGAFVQRWAYEAHEAQKPVVILEANATIGSDYDLTGVLEFSAYVKTPGNEPFSSVSFVAGYSNDLTPCDVEGNPLPLTGSTVPMPTITTEGFASTAVVTPNATARGGLIYMTITAEDEALECDGEFPLATIKFRYDQTTIRPWADDEKDGPYWVESDTSLIWFANVENAANTPWHCRLLYSSAENLYYSTDADHETIYVPTAAPTPDETYGPVRDDTDITTPTPTKPTVSPSVSGSIDPSEVEEDVPGDNSSEESPEPAPIIRGAKTVMDEVIGGEVEETPIFDTPVSDSDTPAEVDPVDSPQSPPYADDDVPANDPAQEDMPNINGAEQTTTEPTATPVRRPSHSAEVSETNEIEETPEGEEAVGQVGVTSTSNPVHDVPVETPDTPVITEETPIPTETPVDLELDALSVKQGSGASYTSVAPAWNFKSNMLSYDDTRTTPQSDNHNKIRVRFVNEPTVARSISEKNDEPVIVQFYNWDDSLLGTLIVSANEDAREAVNNYVVNNLVHPDLRGASPDKLDRASTYRGSADGSDPDGEAYPLTALSDYVFLKRPMTIVRDNVWEQRVGPSGTWDYDERYPYAYGWAIIEDPNNSVVTPSVFGTGELADWAGADTETGAYMDIAGNAPRINVSSVGYSLNNRKYTLENNATCVAPITTDFHFCNFNFSRMEPPTHNIKGLENVVSVKACYEPGPFLKDGLYELSEAPYGTRAGFEATNDKSFFNIELKFTRYIADGDYSVPIIREPAFNSIGWDVYVRLNSYSPTGSTSAYPVRWNEDTQWYDYQTEDGTWQSCPPIPDTIPGTWNGEEIEVSVTTKTNKNAPIWGYNDETLGMRNRLGEGETEILDNGGFGATLQTWSAESGPPEIIDYAITDVYGEGVWQGQFGKLRSVTNETYRPTCQWWKDYFNDPEKKGYDAAHHAVAHQHYDHCWYIHAYSPYPLPPYVDPVDTEAGESLKYNFGPEQIIPAYYLAQFPEIMDFLPPEQWDPNWLEYVEANGYISMSEDLDGNGHWINHEIDSVALGDTITIPYNPRLPRIIQLEDGYDPAIVEVSLDIDAKTLTIKGLALGETDVTISTYGYRAETVHIKVVPQIDRLELTDAHVMVNGTVQLQPTNYQNYLKFQDELKNGTLAADTKITWKSSDETVATINDHGLVTGLKPGWTTITATCPRSVGGNENALTVEIAKIELNCRTTEVSPHVMVNGQVQMVATKYPLNTENDVLIRWASSDEEVATVNSQGLINGLKVGWTTITASCGTEKIAELKIACRGRMSVTEANRWEIGYYETDTLNTTKDLVIPSLITRTGTGDPEIDGTEWEIVGIDQYTFYGCKNLESVVIPGSDHEDRTFSGGAYANGVKTIGLSAFAYCPNLKSVTIPDSVTRINDHAFQGCPALGTLHVPESVTNIGEMAFEGITEVTYSGPVNSAYTGWPFGAKQITAN